VKFFSAKMAKRSPKDADFETLNEQVRSLRKKLKKRTTERRKYSKTLVEGEKDTQGKENDNFLE